MKAMPLNRNELHRKLKAPIRDISDGLVNVDSRSRDYTRDQIRRVRGDQRLPRKRDKLQRASSVPDVDPSVALTSSRWTCLSSIWDWQSGSRPGSLEIRRGDQAHLRDTTTLTTGPLDAKLVVLWEWMSGRGEGVQKNFTSTPASSGA